MLPAAASPRSRASRGFTLIELLTVIAIIGILAAILIPVVGRVREQARTTQCASNLRQIAIAGLLYTDANRGVLPATGQPGGNWAQKITPYLGMDSTSTRSRFICPSAELPSNFVVGQHATYSVSFFLAYAPVNARLSNISKPVVFFGDSQIMTQDGLYPWNYSGYNHTQRLQMFRHSRSTRQNLAMTDGSVRTASGTLGGAFRAANNSGIPNLWTVPGQGYVTSGFDTNPRDPQDFVP